MSTDDSFMHTGLGRVAGGLSEFAHGILMIESSRATEWEEQSPEALDLKKTLAEPGKTDRE